MRKSLSFLAMAIASSFISCVPVPHIWHPRGWWHVMWFGFGGALMWVVYIALVALVIYLLVRSAKSKPSESSLTETPMDILKKRYAGGDITKKEFDKIKKDLQD
jgi:putative membrane protein